MRDRQGMITDLHLIPIRPNRFPLQERPGFSSMQ